MRRKREDSRSFEVLGPTEAAQRYRGQEFFLMPFDDLFATCLSQAFDHLTAKPNGAAGNDGYTAGEIEDWSSS
jgi:hypothetical protein